jgi:hypothetical protein
MTAPYPSSFPTNPDPGDTFSQGGTTFIYGSDQVGWYRSEIVLSNSNPIKLIQTPGFYGQASRQAVGTISGFTTGQFVSTGLAATLDLANTKGLAIGVDPFSLKNITTRTVRALVFGSIDASEAGGTNKLGIRLAKNGTEIPETECRAQTALAGGEAKLVTNWMITFEPGDEVNLLITSFTGTAPITFGRGRLVATKVQP